MSALQELVRDAASLSEMLSDTVLSFGSDAREVGVPVHAIINANKAIDPQLATSVAEGLEFYAAHGRSASRTRARAKASATPASGAKSG
jgi:hypothetical protein